MHTSARPAGAGKHFSLFSVRAANGQIVDRMQVNHYPGAIQTFLSQFPEGAPVALESVGNWYSRKDNPLAGAFGGMLHNGTLPAV